MAYDPFESRRGWREPRAGRRHDEDRFAPRDTRYDRDDDRGFFARAGDEIASWFGDDDAERRRDTDERREDMRYRTSGHGRGESGWRDEHRADRSPRYRDEGYRRPYTGRMGGGMAPGGMSGHSGRSYQERYNYDRAYGSDRWDRGQSQSDMMGGPTGLHDPHYSEWRRRHIDELDRDYDDYRRENQSRFESEFSNWRTQRGSKREMLGMVRQHMDVVGSDDQPIGKVDKVRGDTVILTRADSDDGAHHSVPCMLIERVEGDRIILNRPAEEAKASLGNETRDRALFERDDNRQEGAHMLNRSFSGTY